MMRCTLGWDELLRVAVGSGNPVKVEAVRRAFSNYFRELEVLPVEVRSGVSGHPFGQDVVKGAVNRALKAQREADADFGVGLEGGTVEYSGRVFNCGWCAVVDRGGGVHLGSSGWWECLPSVYDELRRGRELGEVIDEITGRKGVDEQ
ncbi:MAG: DUF84 family protein, partial [Candidatus Bathyarchaeia archaeon]